MTLTINITDCEILLYSSVADLFSYFLQENTSICKLSCGIIDFIPFNELQERAFILCDVSFQSFMFIAYVRAVFGLKRWRMSAENWMNHLVCVWKCNGFASPMMQ